MPKANEIPAAKIIIFLQQLRKSFLALAIGLILCTGLFWFLAPFFLEFLQNHLNQPLAYFSVSEPFLSLAKLAFLSACFTLMPCILFWFWRASALPFGLSGRSVGFFTLFTSLLFYIGSSFCFLITLPLGVKFLLGFQSTQLQPIISMGRFVTFTAIFILAFGAIFQLPVFMVFTAKVGLLARKSYEKNRRYALLIISILAALLTPTPDIVNMMLMAGPLYLLYESGILILRVMQLE